MKLWAIGRYDLHLSEEEFWSLHPEELNALIERRNEEIERGDFRIGLLCALMANIYRDPKKGKAYKPEDFMPSQAKQNHEQSPEEFLKIIQYMDASIKLKEDER